MDKLLILFDWLDVWTGDEDKCWLDDGGGGVEKLLWKLFVELLWEFNWEELLCFGDMDWLDNSVEFGDAELLRIKDFDGVECTELMAARYCNEKKMKYRKIN